MRCPRQRGVVALRWDVGGVSRAAFAGMQVQLLVDVDCGTARYWLKVPTYIKALRLSLLALGL